MKQIWNNRWILTLVSAVLLSAGWVPFEMPFLTFVALVPILRINQLVTFSKGNGRKFYFHCFLIFLLWNTATTHWLAYAALPGFIGAAFANAALMSLPFLAYRKMNAHFKNRWGRMSFIATFLAFEYLHYNWELSWNWLTLGNTFATYTSWIQWYSFTGVLGGSCWILLINYIVYRSTTVKKTIAWGKLRFASLLLIAPIALSHFIFQNKIEQAKEIEIAAVQPNFDSYREKFGGLTMNEQLERMLSISEEAISDSTQFLLWPETALHRVNYNNIDRDKYILKTRNKLLNKYPNLALIAGLAGREYYTQPGDAYRLFSSRVNHYYEEYNSAFLDFKEADSIQIYHKSKLVPLVERLPYKNQLSFVETFSIDLAESMISLAVQKRREIFGHNGVNAAPAICFESVFGEYMTDFVTKGANFITIMTNDSWWYYPNDDGNFIGSKLGFLQHCHYARLRAIENNRYVVRSANTGISCIIDNKGNIIDRLDYWLQGAVVGKIQLNSELTTYSKNGDFLGRWGLTTALILFLLMLVQRKTQKSQSK